MRKQSQRDNRWKNKKLGFSNVTIGNYGCVITSLANMFDITPLQLNDWMKKNGAFVQGNLTYWAKIPGFVWRSWNYDNNKVKEEIKKYGACMVEVDWDGNPRTDGSHFVVFTGNHKMVDAWDGKEKPTSSYKILKGYVVFDIEKAKKVFKNYDKPMGDYYKGIDLNNKESVKVCVDTWKDVVDGKYVKKGEYEKIKRQLDDCRKSVDSFKTKVNDLYNKVDESSKEITSKDKEIANLNKELQLAKNKYETDIGKQKLDCQKKVDDALARMGKDWEVKEKQYQKEIKELKEKVKQKEVVVEKEPAKPKTFKEKLLATIEVWF